jgi:hypothetical protein
MTRAKPVLKRIVDERLTPAEPKPLGQRCPSCDYIQPPMLFARDAETEFVKCGSCRGKGKGEEWRKKS